MKQKRKTRVTKEERIQVQDQKKIKAKKNIIIPGPWTNLDPPFKIKPKIRLTRTPFNEIMGSYTSYYEWGEKGWYPIAINITSADIAKKVKEFGLELYIAAWEKAINTEENKKLYGTIVILEETVDHSQDADPDHRFISCRAKTNRKSITGFSAIRQGKYIILE